MRSEHIEWKKLPDSEIFERVLDKGIIIDTSSIDRKVGVDLTSTDKYIVVTTGQASNN